MDWIGTHFFFFFFLPVISGVSLINYKKYDIILFKLKLIIYGENNMKLDVILEPSEEGGFTTIVPALPGCISEGDTRKEALENIREAIELYLEPVFDDISFAQKAETLKIAI